jgi:hypothetical protein
LTINRLHCCQGDSTWNDPLREEKELEKWPARAEGGVVLPVEKFKPPTRDVVFKMVEAEREAEQLIFLTNGTPSNL